VIIKCARQKEFSVFWIFWSNWLSLAET